MRMCVFVARASAVLFALPLETVELQLDSVLLHTDVANTTMRMLLRSHVGDTTHIAVATARIDNPVGHIEHLDGVLNGVTAAFRRAVPACGTVCNNQAQLMSLLAALQNTRPHSARAHLPQPVPTSTRAVTVDRICADQICQGAGQSLTANQRLLSLVAALKNALPAPAVPPLQSGENRALVVRKPSTLYASGAVIRFCLAYGLAIVVAATLAVSSILAARKPEKQAVCAPVLHAPTPRAHTPLVLGPAGPSTNTRLDAVSETSLQVVDPMPTPVTPALSEQSSNPTPRTERQLSALLSPYWICQLRTERPFLPGNSSDADTCSTVSFDSPQASAPGRSKALTENAKYDKKSAVRFRDGCPCFPMGSKKNTTQIQLDDQLLQARLRSPSRPSPSSRVLSPLKNSHLNRLNQPADSHAKRLVRSVAPLQDTPSPIRRRARSRKQIQAGTSPNTQPVKRTRTVLNRDFFR